VGDRGDREEIADENQGKTKNDCDKDSARKDELTREALF